MKNPQNGERYFYCNSYYINILSDFTDLLVKDRQAGDVLYKYGIAGKWLKSNWTTSLGNWKLLIGQEAENE